MDQPDAVIVLTTWPAATDAGSLATALVGERLAACVNLLPEMESVYSWQGRIERERERQVVIKTTRQRLDALKQRLAQLHPYEVPEVLVLSVAGGSEDYLEWLRRSTDSALGPAQS